ncbi:MAG: tyrosinase family protein [Rubrobacter sp.]|nr:tyrosinase family protein [Rubrobacter sp.]
MFVRKNYRSLTDVERDRFVQALHHVKSTGVVDQFAEIHHRHFGMGIHRSSHFLPWHREMILRFERELQTFHPDVTLPYWDSTVDRSTSSPLWNNNFLGQFNAAWGLGRQLGSATLPTPQQVQTNQGRSTYDAFWPELEGVVHNPPHNWVGGIMAQTRSPRDPVFYLHHCWIDLLWARWQRAHAGAPFVSSGAGLGLNDPMMEWPDRTPADVLDHHALGYSYDIDPIDPPRWIGIGSDVVLRADGPYERGWYDTDNETGELYPPWFLGEAPVDPPSWIGVGADRVLRGDGPYERGWYNTDNGTGELYPPWFLGEAPVDPPSWIGIGADGVLRADGPYERGWYNTDNGTGELYPPWFTP